MERKKVFVFVAFLGLVLFSACQKSVSETTSSNRENTISSKALRFSSQIEKNNLILIPKVQNGYGVQKEGRHVFSLYAVNTSAAGNIKEKIKDAKPLEILQKVLGQTASEDEKYYSQLYPLNFSHPLEAGKNYAVMAKVYVCSFADGFCSVQTEFVSVP